MGNIGGTELLVILVIALLLLGPSRLPEVGDALGRTLRRFRHASREIRDELEIDLDRRPAPRPSARESEPPPAVQTTPAPAAMAAPPEDSPPRPPDRE